MLTDQQKDHFRSILQAQLDDFKKDLDQNDHFQLETEHPYNSVGELSSYDNHPGDTGTELFEQEKDIALNDHEEYELNKIKVALKAIDDGTYGKCKECGKDIPLERLEALPSALYCKEHSPDQTIPRHRPVEEDVLSPPWGKFVFDGSKDESVVFDAEDSWQSVAKWGTSESPSDFETPPDSYNEMYTESDDHDGYVEDFENFSGTDIAGKNVAIYPNEEYKEYEESLDDADTMTTFGDLPGNEKDPYVEDDDQRKHQK
ncbi:TraR/DksA C4-type zinc finger protein [Heyndrickxia acidiproducens]|uniref:TraR/DksA C4-type zinc finger protein n=1 Tax=Heyndrickxia acidiproducens TaxID=1121084 RepID=UPI00036C943C|nr:TraR/DksA C4-type zinc finger protein [Heyndrickxia acidiproducens]